MDSPQRFIGGYNFEVEEWFVDKIKDIPHESRVRDILVVFYVIHKRQQGYPFNDRP